MKATFLEKLYKDVTKNSLWAQSHKIPQKINMLFKNTLCPVGIYADP